MNAVDNENLMLWIVAIVAVVGIVAMALAAGRISGVLFDENMGGKAAALPYCAGQLGTEEPVFYKDGISYVFTCNGVIYAACYTRYGARTSSCIATCPTCSVS